MKRRITISAVIAVLTITSLIFISCFKGKEVESIRTTGIVQGTEVNIMSKISGRISEICCLEGDSVQAGSVVIRLENDDLKAAVEQAKASVQKAIADIQTSEANAEATKAQMDEAERQLERITDLYKEALVSQADFDLAVANFDTASATYKASLSQLTSVKARLKEAQANLSYQKARLNDTVITAPISGTIVFKAMETGEFTSPGIAIFTVVDLDNLWVRIDVEETFIGKIGLGSEAFITMDAMPEKVINGKVSEIGRYAEFATRRDVKYGKQDIKTFHVKINVKDPEKLLKPGMTVNVEIPIKQ